MAEHLVLGAGVTGLSIGQSTGATILEGESSPGGICSSYYLHPRGGAPRRLRNDPDRYRFEVGGGHWIFGKDTKLLRELHRLSPLKAYNRRSGVFLVGQGIVIPYPLQYNLRFLDRESARRALDEMLSSEKDSRPKTMGEWLESTFGPTLCALFFRPFHDRYLANMTDDIAPQDYYKSPIDWRRVVQGAMGEPDPSGYNVQFRYPTRGLGDLILALEAGCNVRYASRVSEIDIERREVQLLNGRTLRFESLLSTAPLSETARMAGLCGDLEPDPWTSVLVLNIGGTRGPKCPSEHWLYVPDSRTGFHRIGFYSNVDLSFVPNENPEKVGIYVERSYPPNSRPSREEIADYAADVVDELKEWEFVEDVEVLDDTWVEVAYTWARPDSTWRVRTVERLAEGGVVQVGRYGRWVFQGISDSIAEGRAVGAHLRAQGHR